MSGLTVDKRLLLGPDAGVYKRVRNNSGGALAAGDVVIWDSTVTYPAVTTTTSADDAKVAGVVVDGNGSLLTVVIQTEGKFALASGLKVDGTTDIAAGDMLSTFTTAKIAQKATAGKAGVFAMALEAYTTNDSSGTIDAYLFPAGRQDASASVSYGLVGVMVADGLAAANSVGVAESASRTDHAHTATADTPALTLGTSNSAGTAGKILASDATVLLFDATNPTTIQSDASASVGTAAIAARRDHQHAVVNDAPVDGSLAAANAEGTSNGFARGDHAHRAMLADDIEFEFGTGYDAVVGWETGDASNHSLVIGLGASNAIHIVEKADIALDLNLAADTHPTLRVHGATTPITEYVEVYTDETDAHLNVKGTAGLDIDVPTGEKVSVQVNDTDEFNFHATELELASGNNVQFLGNDDIVDSNANELVTFSATASAVNGFQIKNAATGNPPLFGSNGASAEADIGMQLLDSNGNELVILGAVASAVNELTVKNAATGNQVILANDGEVDIGMLFNAKDSEEMLSLKATAAATTYVEILSMSTGTTGPAIKALGETNVNLRLIPNGTGQLDVVPGTAGTAARPDIVIGGDVNTGIYEAGADLWAVATAGASALAITAAQAVIIGSTTSSTFTGIGKSLIFDEIVAPAGTATDQAVIYAYDSATVTVMAQQKSDGTNADL